ncbi:MAG: AI-2E family transporter [Gemmatimonadota bacterium]
MPILDTNRDRASWLVAILGVVILLALTPYASGLLGAPVLYVVFAPLFEWLARKLRNRPLAAVVVIIIALIGVVLPVGYMVSLLVGQAQGAVKSVLASPLLLRLDTLRIGSFEIGPQIRQAGSQALSMVGSSAISLLGTATRMTLNLLFTFFGLYYILLDPKHSWERLRPAIPFSDASATILKERFVAITKSTILGTGAAALIQGTMVGFAFFLSGITNPMFWGSVTVLLSVLPVVGSGMVWAPAAVYLFSQGETGWAIGMVVWGLVVVGNVDNLIRPWVSNRYAQIHPLITLVGAVAGVSYLGIIGLLIGPLALSYFFELLSMYRREYLQPEHSPAAPTFKGV